MSFHSEDGNRLLFPTPPVFCRRLQLVVREEEKGDNLFVRLSPKTVSDLYSVARKYHKNDVVLTSHNGSMDAWSLFDENPSGHVSFLPLCVSFGDGAAIFVSYNGGTCASSSKKDVIEVPRSLLSVTTCDDIPKIVSVHVLSRIEYGVQVLVEPLSFKDWELLEVYCASVKEGGLLSQVSVVYLNQNLTVRINEFDRVKIRVKEITAEVSLNAEDKTHPFWPDFSSDDNDSSKYLKLMNTYRKCLLLIQDTEIIVEPKTRPKTIYTSWLDPFRLIPSDAEWGASLQILSTLTKRSSLHVEPGCVVVETEDWPFDVEWAHIRPEYSNETRVIRVVTSSQIPKKNAVLFIGTRFDLNLSLFQDCICLRPLKSAREESLENVLLDEIQLDYEQRIMDTWNRPKLDLANFNCERNIFNCDVVDKALFPIGTVFPVPAYLHSRKGMNVFDYWFRVTSKEADSCNLGLFVSLNMNDILYLYKKRVGRCKEHLNTLVAQELYTIQRPRTITLSPVWTKPIINCMKQFGSIFVTVGGVSGSGKTFSALLLSAILSFNFHRPLYYLDCKKLQKSKQKMDGILEEIGVFFKESFEAAGAIVVLDDLDSLSPNLLGDDINDALMRAEPANPVAIDQSKLISDRIISFLRAVESRGAASEDDRFCLIATCSNVDSINPSILKSSQARIIHTKVPSLSPVDRSNLFMQMIRQHNLGSRFHLDCASVSRCTEDFLPRDFQKLSLRVLKSYRTKLFKTSLEESLIAELSSFTAIAHMSNTKEHGQFVVSWEDIGGLFHSKQILESIVRHPLLYRRIYAKSRMKLPRGILLYGPPGCGKSYLVPALARECNYHLITCKGSEVLDKYIGASEAKIRDLFERASRMAPSILFLDELEALAPRRGSDSTGVTDRVVNQLLTFLDGVEDSSSGIVFIIGATSRPDKVDPAITRPGRLERHLYIGPPNGSKEWSDLLRKIAKNWNLDTESVSALSVGEEIVEALIHQPRLCPADVRAAFDTAHLNAVHQALSGDKFLGDIKKIEIGIENLKFGLRDSNPSLSEDESTILQSAYNAFRGNFSDTSPVCNNKFNELKTSLK